MNKLPPGGPYIGSTVRKAREMLKARSEEIINGYITAIKASVAAGDYESAMKGYAHLIDHLPEDEGERVVDVSVDKPVTKEGYVGPAVQIGIQVGGSVKELPAADQTITITPIQEPALIDANPQSPDPVPGSADPQS